MIAMPSRLKDTYCIDCGEPMKQVWISQKRCPECQQKMKGVYRKRNAEKMRARRGSVPKVLSNQSGCDGCIFYRGSYIKCCCYILMMNKKRPCPPEKACTVRLERSDYVAKKK